MADLMPLYRYPDSERKIVREKELLHGDILAQQEVVLFYYPRLVHIWRGTQDHLRAGRQLLETPSSHGVSLCRDIRGEEDISTRDQTPIRS